MDKMKIIVFMMIMMICPIQPTPIKPTPTVPNGIEITQGSAPYPHHDFTGDDSETPGTRFYRELVGSSPQMDLKEKSNMTTLTTAVIEATTTSVSMMNIDEEISKPNVHTFLNQGIFLPITLLKNKSSAPNIATVDRQTSNSVPEMKISNETATSIKSKKEVEPKVITLQRFLVVYNCHIAPTSASENEPPTYPKNETSSSTLTRLWKVLTSPKNTTVVQENITPTNDNLVAKTSMLVPGTEVSQEILIVTTNNPVEEPSIYVSEKEM